MPILLHFRFSHKDPDAESKNVFFDVHLKNRILVLIVGGLMTTAIGQAKYYLHIDTNTLHKLQPSGV